MIAPGPESAATLHLVAPPSWTPTTGRRGLGRIVPGMLAAAALPRRANAKTTLVTVGDSAAQAEARRIGMRPDFHASPVLGRLRPLVRRLSRLASDAERVVCWSDELAPLATRLGPPCTLVSTASHEIPARSPRPDRVRVVDPCDVDHWSSPPAQVDRALTTRLGSIDTPSPDRDTLRNALGIPEGVLCLGTLEDNPSRVDARQFAFMLGLLSVTGYEVVGVVPRSAARMAQALRHHEGLGRPFRFLIAEEPMTGLIRALDACIVNPGRVSGSSVLLSRCIERTGVRVIDLSVTGRRGFSRSQRVAAKILDQIESVASRSAQHPGSSPVSQPSIA